MKQNILKIILVIQKSFPDASYIYKLGACYGFYQILKTLFPNAQAYETDDKKGHIITKIGGKFYDIRGEWKLIDDCSGDCRRRKVVRLTPDKHLYWEAKTYGQRVEQMLKKLDDK